ncbi:hypothetical protein ACWGKU_05060 [Kitasatospora sp. NPDC054768]
MTFAPLPTHPRVADPDWQARYEAFAPLTAALRRRGFVTDITSDSGTEAITAELPDGTYLHIDTGEADGLPDDIDTATDWRVRRSSSDNPTIGDTVYDSTADGADSLQGALLSPLLVSIDTYLEARGIALLTIPHTHPVVVAVTTVHDHGPATHKLSDVFPDPAGAARYVEDVASRMAAAPGLALCHTSRAWPRYMLARRDHTLVIQATLAELVSDGRALQGRCTCWFVHPQTPQEDEQLGREIAHAIKIGDASGAYLAAARLFTAPHCPARMAGSRG